MKIAAIILWSIALGACGGESVNGTDPTYAEAPPATAAPAPSPPHSHGDASQQTAVDPACVETDESIDTCLAAQAPTSWTAPGTCVAPDINPGVPEKRLPNGGYVRRFGRTCCGFVRVGERVALCCSDRQVCLSDL